MNYIVKRSAFVLLFALLAWTTAVNAAEDQAPAKQDAQQSDQWYATYINGAKSGYTHVTVTPVKEGDRELVKIVSEDKSRMRRDKDVIETIETGVYYETPEGAPVRFETHSKEGKEEKTVSGEMRDGKMIITDADGQKEEVEWEQGATMTTTNQDPFKGAEIKAGATATHREFSLDFRKFVTAEYAVEAREKVKIGDKEMELYRVSGKYKEIPLLNGTIWMDDDGKQIKSEINIGGMVISEVLTDKETAMKEVGDLADVMAGMAVKCAQPFFHPYVSNSVLYRVKVKNSKPADMPLKYDNQDVEETGADYLRLRVKAVMPTDEQILQLPMQLGPEMDEFIKPNEYIQSDYDKIVAAAQKQVGDEKNALKAAKILEKWVFKYIKNKNYGVAFASAKQVFDDPQGDCSEHALLLAAMLRAAGIPSRVCTGIVYESEGRFIWHAWVEGYVGVWVPLDATRPSDFVDCSHIAVNKDSLAKTGISYMQLAVLQCAGNIELEILEYTYLASEGNKKVEKKGAIEGGFELKDDGLLISHRGYGFSLKAPEGCKTKVAEKGVEVAIKDDDTVITVQAMPFALNQTSLLRAELKPSTSIFRKVKLPDGSCVMAFLKNGGRIAMVTKDDCLIMIFYGGEHKDLEAAVDYMLKNLSFK
jgi:hypothetical protein